MDIITFPENLKTTSGLLILLHGVIALPEVTSCDHSIYQKSVRCHASPFDEPGHFLYDLLDIYITADTAQ